MTVKKEQTYDFICFSDLAYEFNSSVQLETEKKIKRRLKYYSLGMYKQDRVDYIRALRNELCAEISLGEKSSYYSKTDSVYANLNDFAMAQLTEDYAKKYPTIDKTELASMVLFSVYLFHTR